MVTGVNGANVPQNVEAQKSKKSSPIGAAISGAAVGAAGGAAIGYFNPTADSFEKVIQKINAENSIVENTTKDEVKEVFSDLKKGLREIKKDPSRISELNPNLIEGKTHTCEEAFEALKDIMKQTKLKTAGKFALIGAGACAVIGLAKNLIFGKKSE